MFHGHGQGQTAYIQIFLHSGNNCLLFAFACINKYWTRVHWVTKMSLTEGKVQLLFYGPVPNAKIYMTLDV